MIRTAPAGRSSGHARVMRSSNAILRPIDAVGTLIDLVAPIRCVHCGRPSRHLCAACAERVAGAPVRRVLRDDCGQLEVWAGAYYEGPVRAAVLAFKRDGARVLGRHLVSLGMRGLAVWSCSTETVRRLRVVPLHSGSRTVRRAGTDIPEYLARIACRDLARGGSSVVLRDLLRQPRAGAHSQKNLAAAERFRNIRGGIQLRVERLTGDDFLLFDDVVTTGASLLEARRLIRRAGGDVVGAACVATVPGHAVEPAARCPPSEVPWVLPRIDSG